MYEEELHGYFTRLHSIGGEDLHHSFPGHSLTSLQADEAKAIAADTAWLPSRSQGSGLCVPKPIPSHPSVWDDVNVRYVTS